MYLRANLKVRSGQIATYPERFVVSKARLEQNGPLIARGTHRRSGACGP